MSFYSARMVPQAIFSPASPDGCVRKSSEPKWIITVLPMISLTRKRQVLTVIEALPPQDNRGGKSPMCDGCGRFCGFR